MSQSDKSDSPVSVTNESETIQAESVEPVHSITLPRTAVRSPPLSTSRAHLSPLSLISSPTYNSHESRGYSPTSPVYPGLSPIPYSPCSPVYPGLSPSPTHSSRAEERPMTPLQPDMASDKEEMHGEVTAMDEDAEMPINEPTEPEHDRSLEFEEHTTQARKSSRKDSEIAEDSGTEALQPTPGSKIQATSQKRDKNQSEDMIGSTGEATSSRDQTVSQERQSEAQDAAGDSTESKPKAVSSRAQAAWVTEAVAAVQANKKNLLNKGTVLIILDPTDPIKSCLLDANTLCRTSEVLGMLYEDAQANSAGCVSQQELSAVLVLTPTSASIPELVAEALDATVESVLPPQPDAHPPAETGRTRSTRSAIAKIKAESDQGDSPPAAAGNPDALEIDWPKAYENLFRMIAGKKDRVPRSDLSTALPQIQGIVQIAEKLDAIPSVRGAFDSLFYSYVGKATFWKSIAAEPVRWINIAIALQNMPVYEEASKHIVGSSSNFKHGKIVDGLPNHVQAIVKARSHDLYLKRCGVEAKLSRISLLANQTPTSRAAPVSQEYPSQFVSQHNQPMVYNTVCIFRDWIADHIGHLDNETDKNPPKSYLCDHSTGCASVAGLFRAIENHDYLDPDEVWHKFNDRFKSPRAERHQYERETVKKSLEALKTKAAGFVEEITHSTLQLADEVGYLTCIDVKREDVPWDLGSDEDSDEDVEESDED